MWYATKSDMRTFWAFPSAMIPLKEVQITSEVLVPHTGECPRLFPKWLGFHHFDHSHHFPKWRKWPKWNMPFSWWQERQQGHMERFLRDASTGWPSSWHHSEHLNNSGGASHANSFWNKWRTWGCVNMQDNLNEDRDADIQSLLSNELPSMPSTVVFAIFPSHAIL